MPRIRGFLAMDSLDKKSSLCALSGLYSRSSRDGRSFGNAVEQHFGVGTRRPLSSSIEATHRTAVSLAGSEVAFEPRPDRTS
jgi:hypothetical protein